MIIKNNGSCFGEVCELCPFKERYRCWFRKECGLNLSLDRYYLFKCNLAKKLKYSFIDEIEEMLK